jgi:hypothetical protein
VLLEERAQGGFDIVAGEVANPPLSDATNTLRSPRATGDERGERSHSRSDSHCSLEGSHASREASLLGGGGVGTAPRASRSARARTS